MNKEIKAILAGAMALSLAACSSPASSAKEETPAAPETTETAETETGVYKVYNVTGSKVTELYLYETGADKGENLAGENGMRNTRSTELTYEGTKETVLTLEYVAEDGTTGKFETLHIEEAPIALLAVDARTGATEIAFNVPQGTGSYTFYNTTGSTLTDLYLYPAGGDKGENLAEGFEDGKVVTFEGDIDSVLVVEFAAEDGTTGKFETLHIEEAPISLIAVDARTGATEISFTQPE